MSEWYDWCKENHVCYRCGKARADEGYTTCLVCRMALRERKKELRRDHINPSENKEPSKATGAGTDQ